MERVLNQHFRLGIHRTRSFVENEDSWIKRQRAGKGQQLALPLRESRPSFLDFLVITIRQFLNERRDVNAARRLNSFLFTAARLRQGDVRGHITGKKKNVL